MKSLFFYLFAIVAFSFTACDKDDPCEPGDLETRIVGAWNVNGLIPVEFKANGDFVDVTGIFVADSIAGFVVTSKRYEVPSNDSIRLIAANAISSVGYAFPVVSYTCDEIVVTDAGVNYTLKAKN